MNRNIMNPINKMLNTMEKVTVADYFRDCNLDATVKILKFAFKLLEAQ